jgi:hypothetical protein
MSCQCSPFGGKLRLWASNLARVSVTRFSGKSFNCDRFRPRILLLLALLLPVFTAPVFAKESDGGTHSKEEIRKACNAVGGELLGVSDLGSYGCENHKTGTMILCNKKQKCTVFQEARTSKDRRNVLETFKLKDAAFSRN